MLRLAVFIGVLWLSASALAIGRGSNFVALDGGLYVTNLKERLSVPAELKTSVSRVAGFARGRRGFHLGKRFFWEPSVALLVPWQFGADGTALTFTSHWDLSFLVPVFSFLRLRVGPGLRWDLMMSSEQAVELANGTSTATFYVPGGTRVSCIWTSRAGFEVLFSRKVSLGVDLFVHEVVDPLRRRFEGAVVVGFFL